MNWIERAEQFIREGGDEFALLRQCVESQDLSALAAVQRVASDMYGDHTFNYELKAPAACCLLCWGKSGIDALREIAVSDPTVKNLTIVLDILSTLASGEESPRALSTIPDPDLTSQIRRAMTELDLAMRARSALVEVFLAFEFEDELAQAVGLAMMQTSIANPKALAARELFRALAARWASVSMPTIAGFRTLIREKPEDEEAFHRFFLEFPQLLDPMAALVWSKPDLRGAKEPDFVVKRVDGTYLIVEIETPAKPLITSRNQVSSQATQAISQAVDYRAFLVERFADAEAHFPGFREPDCLVIIGVEDKLLEEQQRALRRENESRARLRLGGFDWVATRAETVARNMIERGVWVGTKRML